MKRLASNDRMALKSRTVAADGTITAPGVLARTGVQVYHAYELGLDGDPMAKIKLLRPEAEVFDLASMASFDGVPITVEHPSELVTPGNWREYAVGSASNISRSGDFMTAELRIADKAGIDALNSGKAELSNGYEFGLDLTPGVDPLHGAYDGVQRNIRGNHVAIVDAARCGSACRIADSTPPTSKETKMELKKIVIDGLTVEVSDIAAAVIEKTMKAADAALAAAKVTSDAALDAVKEEHDKAIKAKDAKIAELEKDVMTPAARDAMVADWSAMLIAAKAMAPGVATDGKTCAQIRAEVLEVVAVDGSPFKKVATAMLKGKAAKDADADLVRSAFDAVAALHESMASDDGTPASHKAVGDALLGTGKTTDEPLVGRAAMLANQAKMLA